VVQLRPIQTVSTRSTTALSKSAGCGFDSYLACSRILRMTVTTSNPSVVRTGLRLISTGNVVSSFRRPERFLLAAMGRSDGARM